MADVVVPTAPPLARVANVELMHTGTWPISTGVFTFTTADLRQAVAALDCPAVRRPILKLGHVDPRFDGEPAVGYIDNMAVVDGGYTLTGDYAGMPGWLGQVIASAYPDRSIEGVYDFRCQMGHTHPFVLTGLALLGVSAPGIGTLESLQDVAQLYGVDVAAARPSQANETPVVVPILASQEEGAMPNPNPRKVAAAVTSDDIRRAFFETPLGASWDCWITEIQLDPALQVIYCDDESGDSYRVPVTIDGAKQGAEAVTFGAPIKVFTVYQDATVAAAAGSEPIRFASREESRPGTKPAATEPPAEPAEGTTPTQSPEDIVADNAPSTLREGLLTRLGVTDTEADEPTLLAALDEALKERSDPQTPTAPTAPVLPEGVTVIDTALLEELQVAAAAGQDARRQQIAEDRVATVRAAINDGRIPTSRREHWEKAFTVDPEGTKATLDSLAKGLVPVAAAGVAGQGDEGLSQEDRDYYALYPERAPKGVSV